MQRQASEGFRPASAVTQGHHMQTSMLGCCNVGQLSNFQRVASCVSVEAKGHLPICLHLQNQPGDADCSAGAHGDCQAAALHAA